MLNFKVNHCWWAEWFVCTFHHLVPGSNLNNTIFKIQLIYKIVF